MNFEFSSYLFSNNIIFNQNNPSFSSQNRAPFTDLTHQIHSFENSRKNQQNTLFSKNFNGNYFYNEDYVFLKKKSYCENSNNHENYEESKVQIDGINKNKKNFNNYHKTHNSLINNLNEDDDEQDKENLGENNFKNDTKNKELCLSFNQILNEAIKQTHIGTKAASILLSPICLKAKRVFSGRYMPSSSGVHIFFMKKLSSDSSPHLIKLKIMHKIKFIKKPKTPSYPMHIKG